MRFIQTFDLWPFLDMAVGLLTAFVFGTLIGAERQYRQRTAGLRTNVLVAVGAAAFVSLGQRIGGDAEAGRIIAYVVSGIGFLGAGVIMKEGLHVTGLNTAATLWCSGAVGACAGTDRVAEAGLLTMFVLAGNTLLRPLVNAINRVPIDEAAAEATYEVRLTVDREAAAEIRDRLVEELERAQYPVGDVEVMQGGEAQVEIVATLVSTAVNADEIEAVTQRLGAQPGVSHATWESSTQGA
jgi:putative Mg2+ transporter-C (MgtC) family protein